MWDAATAEAIGATWLLARIEPAGAFGRAARARETRYRVGDEAAAHAAIARVAALAAAMPLSALGATRAAIARAPDLADVFVRATNGAPLDDVDFFEIGRLLDAFATVAAPLAVAARADDCGELAALDAEPIADLRAALQPGQTPARGFYLDDDFDDDLARARGTAAVAQARFDAARSRLVARVAAFTGVERVRDGEFLVMRDAIAGALPPELRVLRETPTYLLVEIALDDAALGALSARDAAVARVGEAEERVRSRLATRVARGADACERACEALGDLDALIARAQFAQETHGVVPEIAVDGAYALVAVRDEPLREALAARGRELAPLEIELDSFGIVTGPNMSGKTVALRTLGFAAACVALGVPVPAASARVVLVDRISWLGIGAEPGDDDLLSSFGGEVVAVRDHLARVTRRDLVLVDEFARTTSPRDGFALSVALIETLVERGARGLAATHLVGVSFAARVVHYAVGASGATDYRILRAREGTMPRADALDIARDLGLDAALVARARHALERRDARGEGS